jgi:hypothetical protein
MGWTAMASELHADTMAEVAVIYKIYTGTESD